MKKLLPPIVFLSLFHTPIALADHDSKLDHLISLSLEDLVKLETTIATASKHTTTQAPAVVTLITADDIKATGATNLVDVLEGVPGMHIRTSQFGYRPLVEFRGARATQTLLMINGASMKDLMWGFGIFWKGLPASMIERVEIIRGPGSALFGADAAAGVINIITKTAGTIKQSEAGIRLGSFNTQTAWVQHGDKWAGFDIGLTAELSRTDGHKPLIKADAQTAQDQAFSTNVSLAPGRAQYGWRNEDIRFSIAKNNWRLLSDYMRRSDLGIGLTGAGVLDDVTRGSDSRYNLGLFYHNDNISKDWDMDAELRYQHLNYSSGQGFQERPPGYTDASGLYPQGQINHMKSAERQISFETSGLYTGIEDHSLRMGIGFSWQDLYYVAQRVNSGTGPDGNPLPAGGPIVDLSDTGFAFAPEKMRRIHYVFAQDIWKLADNWELTAGVRHDRYSDFGSTLNPRLALVWQTTSQLTSKLMYGRAFRDPSYQELFAITSRSLPNPNLDPERSSTLDLSFSYAASNTLQLNMNLYSFRQTDIIRAIDVGLAKNQFQNSGDHNINGIELEARWQASDDLNLSANYTRRSQDNDFRIFQEPDQDAYIRADWGFQAGWNWDLQANWIGKRPRPSSDSRSPVDAYLLADTTLRYAGSKRWELAASIRNLFDTDAREYTGRSIPNDLPLPGRNYYVEMRYKF